MATSISKKIKDFSIIFTDSLKSLVIRPWTILIALAFFAFFTFFVSFSFSITQKLSSTFAHISWLVAYILIILISISLTCWALFHFAKPKNNFSLRSMIIQVLLIIPILFVTIQVKYNLLPRLPDLIIFIGSHLGLSLLLAKILFITVYCLFLFTLVLLLIFPIAFIVTQNSSFFGSFVNSFRILKKNYLESLSLFIVFFILDRAVSELNYSIWNVPLYSLINYGIMFPLAALAITKFIIVYYKK